MNTGLMVATVLAFAGGVALSFWHARRRFRARLADRIAREVERELARRVVEELRGSAAAAPARKSP